ncbi:Aste57867_24510 [Aphanomyces stellatus]|uniref:Aste57867_24510 protein n=1 Tax=Aphanomyces stellatus TaxID=120398 RepID=A0A485LUX7_9STRA|nr:hypothetical protein As57867_024433 [Aphanomyces stellatus]VFU01149.1 Aste57867_24510 [Aphanomyces stellatus]
MTQLLGHHLREKEPDWLYFIDALPSIQEASREAHQDLKAGKTIDCVRPGIGQNLASVPEIDKFQEAVEPFPDKAKETSK